MTTSLVSLGIDVSKTWLDIAVRPTGASWQVANDPTGITALVADVAALQPAHIVLEATGGLEAPVAAALATAGLPVAVVNPRQVRDFAKATGKLAKTDALDAAVLAHFGEAVQPTPRPLPDAQAQVLSELLTRRSQLVAMVTAEQNRRASLTGSRRAGRGSSGMSAGCGPNCARWKPSCVRRCRPARCGGNERRCCGAFREWGRWWP